MDKGRDRQPTIYREWLSCLPRKMILNMTADLPGASRREILLLYF